MSKKARFAAWLLGGVLLGNVVSCSPVLAVDGGYFDTFSGREGRAGVSVNLRAGVLNTNKIEEPALGLSVGLRTKFSPALIHVALSACAVLTPFSTIRAFTPYLRLGYNSYQLESVDESFAFGMFSPWVEGGMWLRLNNVGNDAVFLTLGGGVEYVIRFTDQPNEGYWHGLIGLGFGGGPRPPIQFY